MSRPRIALAIALIELLCQVSLGQRQSRSKKQLPAGVLRALTADETDFCDQCLSSNKKSCRDVFRHNLLWRKLVISPAGQEAFLVENHNEGACGSAGCALFLLVLRDGQYRNGFGLKDGLVGDVGGTIVRDTVTKGYFDLEVTEGKDKVLYRWDGLRYYPVGNCKNADSYPRFEDYPAQAYLGRQHAPILTTHLDRLYRTRIREAAHDGPNFAGHFAIAEWGCGTGCSGFVIVDLISGAVYDPPFQDLGFHYWPAMENHPSWSEESFEAWSCEIGNSDSNGFLFHKFNSDLLVVEGCFNDRQCGRTFFVMSYGKLKQVKFDPDLLPDGSVAEP